VLSCLLSYSIYSCTYIISFCKFIKYFLGMDISTSLKLLKVLDIRRIGCTWNGKMHPCILSFTSKLHILCGKIFHDKAWNILPHHVLFTHGKQIHWKYSIMLHGIFLAHLVTQACSFAHLLVLLRIWVWLF
jgi:hypothetical protein